MLFIEYPKCTTCKKAKAFLDSNGVNYIDRHIKEFKPTLEELTKWQEAGGIPLRKMFNTSGLLYKELGLKDKLDAMSDNEKLKLLSTDGMLVKRPILITDKSVLFGFKEEDWKNVIK